MDSPFWGKNKTNLSLLTLFLHLFKYTGKVFHKKYKNVRTVKNTFFSFKIFFVWLKVSKKFQDSQFPEDEPFKEAVSRDFRTLFFSWIEPIWVPDKQSKIVLLKNSFSRRYSNLKFKNSTPRRLTLRGVQIFWQASPLKV